MDPAKEQLTPEPKLSLQEQISLVKNSNSIQGIQRFGDALVGGRLDKLINIKLPDFKNFFSPNSEHNPSLYPGDKTLIDYHLEHNTEDKTLWIDTSTDPERIGTFELKGDCLPGKKYQSRDWSKSSRGLNIQLSCEYVAEPGKERMRIKEGTIALHTSDDFHYDAMIVFDGEGNIKDVLPSKDYDPGNKNAELMQKAREKAKAKTLAVSAIPALDYLETDLKERGITLSHERTPGEYDALRSEVAQLLGIKSDELLSKKIDPWKTFEAIMNNPLPEKPVVKGLGTTAVPTLVFA